MTEAQKCLHHIAENMRMDKSISEEGYEYFQQAIKALDMVDEFEKAQIITGGRLNGRTYAYKCGLEDGKRKALKQEPCGDAISRQAAIEKIHWLGLDNDTAIMCDLTIRTLPSVNPQEPSDISNEQEPKTGHWIWCVGSHKCSNCEEYTCFSHKEMLRYCPNCGAKMESEVEQ